MSRNLQNITFYNQQPAAAGDHIQYPLQWIHQKLCWYQHRSDLRKQCHLYQLNPRHLKTNSSWLNYLTPPANAYHSLPHLIFRCHFPSYLDYSHHLQNHLKANLPRDLVMHFHHPGKQLLLWKRPISMKGWILWLHFETNTSNKTLTNVQWELST